MDAQAPTAAMSKSDWRQWSRRIDRSTPSGEIARRLAKHPDLVVRVGETTSEDIFHHRGSAVVWRKVE